MTTQGLELIRDEARAVLAGAAAGECYATPDALRLARHVLSLVGIVEEFVKENAVAIDKNAAVAERLRDLLARVDPSGNEDAVRMLEEAIAEAEPFRGTGSSGFNF